MSNGYKMRIVRKVIPVFNVPVDYINKMLLVIAYVLLVAHEVFPHFHQDLNHGNLFPTTQKWVGRVNGLAEPFSGTRHAIHKSAMICPVIETLAAVNMVERTMDVDVFSVCHSGKGVLTEALWRVFPSCSLLQNKCSTESGRGPPL